MIYHLDTGTILQDEHYLPAALTLISKARKSICISTFKAEITTRPRGRLLCVLFDTLYEKVKSGVSVRFLINKVTKKGSIPLSNMYAIQEMPKHGINVRCLRNERCCHAKLLVVDDVAAILGSHNLSVKSCHNNFEVSYESRDIIFINYLQHLYDSIWYNAQEV